ncbi:MAG: hypothetical protein Kow0092_11600 [Deferrisomatales bacterium]
MGVPSTAWYATAESWDGLLPAEESPQGRPPPWELQRYWSGLAMPASRVPPLGEPWETLSLGAVPRTRAPHGNAGLTAADRVHPDEKELSELEAVVGRGRGSRIVELARRVGAGRETLRTRITRRHGWPRDQWLEAERWLAEQKGGTDA